MTGTFWSRSRMRLDWDQYQKIFQNLEGICMPTLITYNI